MSAIERFLKLALHSYEWGEMTLLEQGNLRDEAAAELEAMREKIKHLRRELEQVRQMKREEQE